MYIEKYKCISNQLNQLLLFGTVRNIDFHLYEKNNFIEVRKRHLDRLLPLQEIDFSAFKNIISLSVLESCSYCDVIKLKAGSYITDFNSLSNTNLLKNLEVLDLSRSSYCLDHFNDYVFPKVADLNISGLTISVVSIITSFPNLKTIKIRNSQYSVEEQNVLENAGVRIQYDDLKPLPFEFNSFELTKYNSFLSLDMKKAKSEVLKIAINSKGEVVNVKSKENHPKPNQLYKSLKQVLFFESVDENIQRILYLPIRVE